MKRQKLPLESEGREFRERMREISEPMVLYHKKKKKKEDEEEAMKKSITHLR